MAFLLTHEVAKELQVENAYWRLAHVELRHWKHEGQMQFFCFVSEDSAREYDDKILNGENPTGYVIADKYVQIPRFSYQEIANSENSGCHKAMCYALAAQAPEFTGAQNA